MDKIIIGIVCKPQGVKGQLKVKLLADNFETIKNLKSLYIDNKEYKINNIRALGEEFYIDLNGITDRDCAEIFRGKEVFAVREELNIPEDSYFIVDLIGCEIYLASGKLIGVVEDIISSNVDIYYIKTLSEGMVMCPIVSGLKISTDIESKKIVFNSKRFTEVAVYED